MKKQIEQVKEFHELFSAPMSHKPMLITEERTNLRFDLMREENDEYWEACADSNIVEVADALGDMLYILCGTIIEHGMQDKITEVFDEIHRSNMSKIEDGVVLRRADGKIQKGKNYFKPNIEQILNK